MLPRLAGSSGASRLIYDESASDITVGRALLGRSNSVERPMEARWLTWGRSGFAVGVVVVLVVLGLENMALRPQWQEVEDGVNWAARAEGVTAVEVVPGSSGEAAGVRPGDILEAVNGLPVRSPADVVEQQHRASEGTRLSYLLLRLGSREALEVTLAPAPRGSSMYFVLACVGLFTLVVGAAVRVRRPRDPATLHFFWLCVAFFGAFTFSFNGPLDRLDWVFYWGDAVAQALLPPLLLHFMLVFPERPASARGSSRRLRPAARNSSSRCCIFRRWRSGPAGSSR